MEKKEIERRNEAIAVFMGGKLSKPRNAMNAPKWTLPNRKNHLGNPETIYDLYYHRSWDWIIPAVQKIRDLKIEDFPRKKPIMSAMSSVDIDELFIAVSDFCLTTPNKQ